MTCDHCGESTKVCGQADTGNVCEDCLDRARRADYGRDKDLEECMVKVIVIPEADPLDAPVKPD